MTQNSIEESEATTTLSARDRILASALELFYRDGIRAVGIDAVIAHSGVAKMSLYRNFASKDELIVAFLEERRKWYWDWWDGVVAAHAGRPREQLRAIFQALGQRTTRDEYRGCPFINTSAEFPEKSHPARAVVRRHKDEMQARLRALTAALGARDPDGLADQLILVIDGAYATGQILGAARQASAITAAAEALIEAGTSTR